MPTAGERALQETLHILLSRLAATMEHVKNWPSDSQPGGGSADPSSSRQPPQAQKKRAPDPQTSGSGGGAPNVHVAATSRLIEHVQSVVAALRRVESTVQSDPTLQKSLRECLVPLDLLDVLDSSKIHPDCFARGLMREALGQLAGLRRRKLALGLLGNAVQSGMLQREQQRRKQQQKRQAQPPMESDEPGPFPPPPDEGDHAAESLKKRSRSVPSALNDDDDLAASNDNDGEPPAKRQHIGG